MELPAERPDDLFSDLDRNSFMYFFNLLLSSLSKMRSDIDDDAWVTDFTFGDWDDPNIEITLGLIDEHMRLKTYKYHTIYLSKAWCAEEYGKALYEQANRQDNQS